MPSTTPPFLKNFKALFLAFSWLWLLLHAALSTYTLSYEFAWLRLIAPSLDRAGSYEETSQRIPLAIVFVVLSSIFRLAWISCWIPCLYYTWWKDRYWTSGSVTNLIMQATRDYDTADWAPRDAAGNLTVEVSGRPRICPKCLSGAGDRVYHDKCLNRCRPVFDHYCYWIMVSVYLRTMKLYLYLLLFLPLDLVITMAFSIFAVSHSSGKSALMFFTPMLVGAIVMAYYATGNAVRQWVRLAWRNEVYHEYKNRQRKPIALVFKVGLRHGTILKYKAYTTNPWDLGPKENLNQVLGETWLVKLCPWIQPARVRNYYKRPSTITDFLFRQEVWRDRTKFLDASPGFTGVTIEGSAQHQPVAIDFAQPRRPGGPHPRRAARSSAVEPSEAADESQPRRRGGSER